MEKTIENIKKILHIGAGSKVEKKNGKIHSHGSTPEKQKTNHQAVTTSVDINRGEKKRYQNIKIQNASYAGCLDVFCQNNDDRIKSMFVLTLVWMQKQNIISTWKEESSSLLLCWYLGARRRKSRRFPWLMTSSTGMRRTTPWRGAGAAGEEWRMERWDINLWLNESWSVVRGGDEGGY